MFNANISEGRPTIKGTNVTVESVLELLAQGWSQERLLENHSQLKSDDIYACLGYAAERIHMDGPRRLPKTLAARLS